jgi:UDP-glucose 4-epimerase
MKKAVVTGGAGFIGSHIAEGLVKRGYRVVIIDNLSSGKLSNIKSILGGKNAGLINGSIADLTLLRKAFSGAEYVFHQAALTSVPRSVKNPRATHVTNATGTLNVLIAARDNGVKKVVYASSSAVYGDTTARVQKEDLPPNPLSPYAVTKLAGEYYGRVFREIYGLQTASLRYFNVYGPRQDPGSDYAAVIPAFISRVLSGKPPVIYGDGEQTRDFVYVKDVVEANILAVESTATGVFNIGSGQRVTINDLARLIITLCGKEKIRALHKEPRPGDIRHSLADITKAGAFGYRPVYSLEDGLSEVIGGVKKQGSTGR